MTWKSIVVLGAAFAIAACEPDLTVPNLNNPSVGGSASRSSVVATAQGLLGNARGMSMGTVGTFGIWGRELYTLAPEEPRPLQDNLVGPRDPLSSGSGAGFNYGTLVEVRELLNALDGVGGMTDQEKEGIRGWAKTVAAFAYSQTAMVYPESGAPIRPPANPTGELEPIATAQELYGEAVRLFDEAYQHLQNAGSTFAFGLTEGYDGFDTPQTFAELNRALKARALKYSGDFQGTLTALGQSFIDASAPLELGVYHNFFAEDALFNQFFSPRTGYVHPRILDEAQVKANGQPDDRAVQKTVATETFTMAGITVTEKPNVFPENTSPFPWITNEELLLLRAEARLATGDAAGALSDVNVVRTQAGGLPAVSGLSGDALLTEILYNKLYSLLYLGGFSYFDARQYDRLDDLPRALPSHVVFDRINWPAQECVARVMTTGPCGPVDGF
jgi:hypothetical protein